MPTNCNLNNRTNRALLLLAVLAGLCSPLAAGDWPTWRYDSRRSASSPEKLPEKLEVQWQRQWPALKPAFRSPRLQFDAGYEPIISGGLVFIASSFNDSVTALKLADGSQAWRFHADGPVRFAPSAHAGKIYFGSDDGYLYCLQAASGTLEWKFRAAPARRKLLGNGRIISAWPIRGGPVIDKGRIYFAAGVWSFEGVFVYCLDAKTGQLVWLNERGGYIYGPHPHGARAFGGVSPQGYLVINGDELVVPCSAAYPARFDLASGKIKDFSLPGFSRVPGGWFAMADTAEGKAKRRGKVILDSKVNSERHEDRPRSGLGTPGSASRVDISGKTYSFTEKIEGIRGKIHSIAAADSTGSQTIVFASSLAGQTLNLNAVSLNESLTFDMDQASGLVLTGGTLSLAGGTTQTFNGTYSDQDRGYNAGYEGTVPKPTYTPPTSNEPRCYDQGDGTEKCFYD